MTTPIFLLSLPRSGSTLLQRMIATHESIATASEPWLLLPLFLGYRQGQVYSRTQQPYQAQAFHELLSGLPDGAATRSEAIRRFADTFYSAACGTRHSHFLDKTPRYHLIAKDLLETFPDAHFVLLWRNPLAVAASCIETWGRGRFNLDLHRIDLYDGLASLVTAAETHPERIVTLRYEDLVADPDRQLAPIFAHVGLAPVPDASRRYRSIAIDGSLGDKKGEVTFDRVSTEARDTWPRAFATPLRRRWAHRYLSWLGAGRLTTMGYDERDLRAQLDAHPLRRWSLVSDAVRMVHGRWHVARERAWLRPVDIEARSRGESR